MKYVKLTYFCFYKESLEWCSQKDKGAKTMANSKDLELKLNDSSQVIRDSYTVKLAEKDQVSLNITGDVAGQVAYAPKGNDIVVTVYNKQEHEDATEEYTYSRVKTTYAETSAEGATTKTYSVTTVTENLTNGEWVAASDSKTEAYTPKEGETVNTKDPSYAYTKTTTYLTKSNKDITSSVDSSYKFVANNGKAAEGTSPAVAATEEYNYKEEHAVWTKTTTGSGESAKTTYSYHTETSTYDFTNNKWGDAVKSAESEAQDTAPTGVTFKENETTASTASVYTQIVHKLPSSASYKPTTDDTFVASNEVSEKVLDTDVAATMTSMLKMVVKHGTGMAANIGKPCAGKTGTTDDYKDAWFVGFTPSVATGVWVGNDDNTKMGGLTGGTVPAVIWRDVMRVATEPYGNEEFGYPDMLNTKSRKVNRLTTTQNVSRYRDDTDEVTPTEDVVQVNSYNPQQMERRQEQQVKPIAPQMTQPPVPTAGQDF